MNNIVIGWTQVQEDLKFALAYMALLTPKGFLLFKNYSVIIIVIECLFFIISQTLETVEFN